MQTEDNSEQMDLLMSSLNAIKSWEQKWESPRTII